MQEPGQIARVMIKRDPVISDEEYPAITGFISMPDHQPIRMDRQGK